MLPLAMRWSAIGRVTPLDGQPSSGLDRLRHYLFAASAPPPAEPLDAVELFSAPGEGRESVEIARRVLREARRGVPFDRMAIALRSPQHYAGLLEHALERAGVPAYFDRGTRRPHPAGRAFLSLLACAIDNLSAQPLRRIPVAWTGPVPRPGRGSGAPRPGREGGGRLPDVERRGVRCMGDRAGDVCRRRSRRRGRAGIATRPLAARSVRRGNGSGCSPSRA